MKPTILLADDSSTIQRLVERTFDGSNLQVVSVSNGEAAVRKLAEMRPSAVLADIHMPGKNGYEVCRFVKQDPSLSALPVVLLVGAFEVFDEAEARRAGADAWVTKPFEPKQLASIVAGLIGSTELEGRNTGPAGADHLSGDSPIPASSGHSEPYPAGEPALEVVSQAPAEATRSMEPAPMDSAHPLPEGDILGLKDLFPPSGGDRRPALSPEEVDAIADRVIERLSAEVVESIAWDIVPEIADRVMRDQSKREE